jgi:hypothetical protein
LDAMTKPKKRWTILQKLELYVIFVLFLMCGLVSTRSEVQAKYGTDVIDAT